MAAAARSVHGNRNLAPEIAPSRLCMSFKGSELKIVAVLHGSGTRYIFSLKYCALTEVHLMTCD